MSYANNTLVSIEKSEAEIKKLLGRYGANQIMSYSDPDKSIIQFAMCERVLRMTLMMPILDDYRRTPTGLSRSSTQAESAWKQAHRSRWRSLLLTIKAKLDAIDVGIVTFEEEFMPYIVLPNKQTVGEFMLPQIEQAYLTGETPSVLPGLLQLEEK